MSKAIGMVEYKTVSAGVAGADHMIKTAEVAVLEAQTVCPGKYIVLISGDLSAVNAAVESARTQFAEKVIDSFILGNPHESIFSALYGASDIENAKALGTFSAASIIVAADVAAKTAQVELIELRVARGMCGKSYMMLTGDIAAVESAIEKAKNAVGEGGMYLDSSVIANPDAALWRSIL